MRDISICWIRSPKTRKKSRQIAEDDGFLCLEAKQTKRSWLWGLRKTDKSEEN